MGIVIILVGAFFGWLGFNFLKNASIASKANPQFSADTYKLCGGFIVFIAIIIIGIGVFVISIDSKMPSSVPSTSNRAEYTKTCPICHREFKDDANIKSIRLNNMCSNCYHNYETATDAGY